ncbi:ARM repeat-containing protein [Panus rudis PR-1116 ss-1]|nr:ARM repeat-containing protein [Panus rudis PR-1116 ss-1]
MMPSASATPSDTDLENALKRTQEPSWNGLIPSELDALVTAFLPSQPFSSRSTAYVVLAGICQRLRDITQEKTQGAALESISKAFAGHVTSKLAETEEQELLAGLTFLTALFQVDWQAAANILTQDGTVEAIVDSLDLYPLSPGISLAVAHLLSQAAGHKSCRAVIPSQGVEWLESKARQGLNKELQVAAAVALVKLQKGAEVDSAGVSDQDTSSSNGVGLVGLMKDIILLSPTTSPSSSTSLSDAIEGLAYISADPRVKETLASDKDFLKRLFSLIPRKKTTLSNVADVVDTGMTPLYGTLLIISNICTYRPRLSSEEAQIAKLRRMAAKASTKGTDDSEANKLDDDEQVQKRCRRLVEAGVADALSSAVRASDSHAVRLLIGKAFLSLVEDKENRGKVLQAGGAKALMTIIQGILANAPKRDNTPQLEQAELEPIQALAKLTITSAPVQVFGPNAGALFDAIRPLALLLTSPNANLLQQFEAIMALTNIASASEEASTKVAKADGLMNKVELLMLEDHTLVRRAATELICNLVAGCEEIYNRYGGEKSASSKSKIQVLAALCDVDDLPTRLAASGALATLTSSPNACQSLFELQRERHRVLPILAQLIDPTVAPPPDTSPTQGDPGLVHRGAVCIRNFFAGIEDTSARKELAQEAHKLGLVQALARVFRENSTNRSNPVLRPTAEALKMMMECGISITT